MGGSPTLLTQRLLKKWGLEADVKFLATGGYVESVAALEKRRIHAAVLDPPRAYIGRKKFGFIELANLGQEFKYATTVIVARESQLRKEREIFSQFAKGVIEGIHRVKTDREFAIKVLGKMLRSNDREILEETYRVFSALYEKAPYPTLEGIQPILDEISAENTQGEELQAGKLRRHQYHEATRSKWIYRQCLPLTVTYLHCSGAAPRTSHYLR